MAFGGLMRQRKKTWAVIVVIVAVFAMVATMGVLLLTHPWQRQDPPPAESIGAPGVVQPSPGDYATNPAYAVFYHQKVAWETCETKFQCAAVTVPVDWKQPQGSTITIKVAKLPASNPAQRLGALLVNPGGPGGSGVDYVLKNSKGVATDQVRRRYDLVGFDPRGVGKSSPIDCVDDRTMDRLLAEDINPEEPAGMARLQEGLRTYVDGCKTKSGALLAHVDSGSVVRDMDLLRALLGDERLNYLGASYGTKLGAYYAQNYPHRVGRMVLDGAIDPQTTYSQTIVSQAKGMEDAVASFISWCVSKKSCPIGDTLESGQKNLRERLNQLHTQPISVGSRSLTYPSALTGVIAAMYDPGSWPPLRDALKELMNGKGTMLLAFADSYTERQPDGSYSGNLLESYDAVTCLDEPVDASPASVAATKSALQAASPTFGTYLSYGEFKCAMWPHPPVMTPGPLKVGAVPPILIVGTTRDPATPYVWSQRLTEQIPQSRLLTLDGDGHTAYTKGSDCIDGAVDGYLLEDQMPVAGATCQQ